MYIAPEPFGHYVAVSRFPLNSPPLSFCDHERLYAALLLEWTTYAERGEANRGKRISETFGDTSGTTLEGATKRSRPDTNDSPTSSKQLRVILTPFPSPHPRLDPLPIPRQILPRPFRRTLPHRRREDLQNVISSFEVVLGCRLESWRRFGKIAGNESEREPGVERV